MNETQFWKEHIANALQELAAGGSGANEISGDPAEALSPDKIVAEIPPDPTMGDIGFPMFSYAKVLRKAPPVIAAAVESLLVKKMKEPCDASGGVQISALGPYINVRRDRGKTAVAVLSKILNNFENYGKATSLEGRRIMVEFSSPNTNKPLHLGHLRNDVLGESISRILAACGAEVRKVCIINDRGIHICKSMLAYQEIYGNSANGEPKTHESQNIKSDHFVGNCYVAFNDMSKTDGDAINRAQELLRKWEAGDAETTALWKKMNAWTVDGIKETYKRTGVSFDQYYFESQTYLRGKEEVLKGLEKNIFYREADGSVWADLSPENLDKKTLLRKDGTSLYITQDFGTAILRHDDWPFDKLVYVVGNEQRYHFMVLFTLLLRLGFEWAKDLYHLSYGMVNLPSGKMKSREGTVVDADDLLDELQGMALNEIREKEREEEVGNADTTAEKIALGALHYFLLQISPDKDMLFTPKESIAFNGNTGPYLQYTGARISSILKKDGIKDINDAKHFELLTADAEWELIKTLDAWQDTLQSAAEKMNPSGITTWLYELAKNFSRFYHECPILSADDANRSAARLALCRAVRSSLQNAMELVCIPFLQAM